jgi:hypothetical protein
MASQGEANTSRQRDDEQRTCQISSLDQTGGAASAYFGSDPPILSAKQVGNFPKTALAGLSCQQ